MLKVIERDNRGEISFIDLHKKYKRATPLMWSNYVTAITMWDLICLQTPEACVPGLIENVLHNERTKGMRFTRNNRTKMGFNCITNRFQKVLSRLNVDWQQMSKETYKKLCKEIFINEEILKLRS